MDAKEMFNERVEIFDDAVRMIKAPKRVPFVTNDAFWRYYDLGYKLSEAMNDLHFNSGINSICFQISETEIQ